MKKLGIYIHIPFCKSKCYYCDFVSFSCKDNLIEKYIECLKKEIKSSIIIDNTENYTVNTIYIGGGTPSYVDSKYIVDVLNEIKQTYKVEDTPEITIEVNPGTITNEKLKDMYEAGINRLSIGLQSDNDDILKTIGRIHNYKEFLNIYNLARKIGFKNINIDLMLALPGQSLEQLEDTVNNVIKLKPEHISIYSLILEEGTKLEKLVNDGKLKLPEEELERQMYYLVREILKQNEYYQYEISNYSKVGYESKHNLACWNQEEYIGFGTAAHSYVNKERFSNIDNLEQYISNIENDEIMKNYIIHEIHNREAQMNEYMILGLRKIEGISILKFKEKFNENPIYLYRNKLSNLVNKELVEIDGDNIKLTLKGIDFANIVWEEFI